MLYEIWTLDALEDVEDILEYLRINWNDEIIARFYSDVDEILTQIKDKPATYSYADKKRGIRSCLPNEHCTLYYKVIGPNLYVLRLYANPKDPKKLRFRI